MNGQYLMNKEISVQYAYKKDGKGERHGDQAERVLASQARKHNVQPTAQPLPAALFGAMPPMGVPQAGMPSPITNGPPMVNGIYNNVPPPQSQRMPPQNAPLAPPPPGLPARPPPSQAGYGGPQGFVPGLNNMPQGFGQPPPGPVPPGFGPPPGFPQMGAPPPRPPGFQQGFARR